jgi:hypothetical protein
MREAFMDETLKVFLVAVDDEMAYTCGYESC